MCVRQQLEIARVSLRCAWGLLANTHVLLVPDGAIDRVRFRVASALRLRQVLQRHDPAYS